MKCFVDNQYPSYPAIDNRGQKITTISALDSKTEVIVYMPEDAFKKQKEFKKWDLETVRKRVDMSQLFNNSTVWRYIYNLEVILKYAETTLTTDSRKEINKTRELLNTPAQGIWGVIKAKYFANPYIYQKKIEDASNRITDERDRMDFLLAINELEYSTMVAQRKLKAYIYQIDIFAIDDKVFAGELQEARLNILSMLKEFAEITWYLENYYDFKTIVNQYDKLAYQYGFCGYNYSDTAPVYLY